MRVLLATMLCALALAAPAAAAPELVKLGDFTEPVHVTSPPGDTRLFVVEKAGTVRVVKDGTASLFLDIGDAVRSEEAERGLLSIAFPPDYASSGRFYVYFTDNAGDIVIAEYQRRPDNPDAADAGSRRNVLVIPHPTHANHNGGQLQFGPDGLLYAGTGDGGSANDPSNNAQNLDSALGKILRLDPRPSADKSYTVPPGNPFSGSPSRDLVWSYGLRNPWRFSFDRANRDLWIGDVGQYAWEEVDHAPAAADGTPGGRGSNWGWRCFEGTHQNTAVPACDPPDDIAPVHEYANPAEGRSVVGGYVVRDAGVPSLAGRFLFADAYEQDMRQLDPATRQVSGAGLSATGVVSFGEDACGRILVATQPGPVYRIREAGAADPPCVPPPPPGSGTPPPGGPAPPPGGVVDRRAPRLFVALGSVRGLIATGRLRPRLRCDEPCVVRASTAVAGVKRRARGRAIAGPDKSRFLTIKLSPKQRRALKRALKRRRVVTLMIRFVATDAARNRSTTVKRLRLRGV